MTAPPPPAPGLRASVVVPARDEERRIGACLDALAAQAGITAGDYEVIVVLDACRDATAARVADAAARHPRLVLHTLMGAGRGAGHARRLGMEAACARLLGVGRPDGLVACTDADSRVAPDWLAAQLAAVAAGARAIGGRIELGGDLPVGDGVAARRRRRATRRLAALAGAEGAAEHPHFSGASIGVTAETYRAAGGLAPRHALEDRALEGALRGAGVRIERLDAVRVVTSARREARAPRGLAADLRLDDWLERRSFRGADFTLPALLAAERGTISVVLPAREVADTVGAVLDTVVPLRDAGLVDEVLVVDAASRDGTAEVARRHGATVVQESELLDDAGPCLGKGDAMWRALAATTGEIVCFLDADSADPSPSFLTGLLGPLLTDPGIALVKGAFTRPLRVGGALQPDGGGRVTELVARPLLNLFSPDLAGFAQPLAGEIAARRSLLERLPFPVGYGVEIAMLMDAHALVGLDGLAQVDLGRRLNRHQPLRELSAMSVAVIDAALRRGVGADALAAFAPGRLVLLEEGDADVRDVPLDERPPLALRRATAAGAA